MTWFVTRDKDGKIDGLFRAHQPDTPEEALADDNAEVRAHVNPPPDPRMVEIKADPGRAALRDRLASATPAQIDAYVDADVTTLAQARGMFKAILKLIALDARG